MYRKCHHGVPITREAECLHCDLIYARTSLKWLEEMAATRRKEIERIERALSRAKGNHDCK